MDESPESIAKSVAAVGGIDTVPALLHVLCEITGMGFAMVARVTGKTWTACAVQDDIHLGVKPGDELALGTNLAFESQDSRTPIAIEQISTDAGYSIHDVPQRFRIESYVAVPICLSSGRYFGNLCALDPKPAKVAEPRIVSMFNRFAAIIASQLDQQLLREQAQNVLLEERAAGQLREQFIAILGHDLRNPLQAVYMSCDSLERKLTDPDLLGIASRIKANARRMSSLVDDVLDFARGRLGSGIEVEITEVENINSGLTTVVQELQDAQPDCKIISSIGVSRSVRCDLGRLQQVASNLLANALTHGHPHGPVKITACADENDLVLEVWNAGEPIPPESIDKMFEPFWRHSASASRNGLGLGLHICSQIVCAHEGLISVTSTRDSGTTFTVRLPLGPVRHTIPGVRGEALGDDYRAECALNAFHSNPSSASAVPLASV